MAFSLQTLAIPLEEKEKAMLHIQAVFLSLTKNDFLRMRDKRVIENEHLRYTKKTEELIGLSQVKKKRSRRLKRRSYYKYLPCGVSLTHVLEGS